MRCAWANPANPLYVAYHDEEWGVPSHHDRHLFEMLILEGAQAGLSWETILNKRAAYRRAYDRFDPLKVARYGVARQRELMADAGIVRNRLKIESSVSNAKAFLDLRKQHGTFASWLWNFVDGEPVVNLPRTSRDVPARTALADTISKELKNKGFRFVGPTIIYAFLQAVGVVNDHAVSCFRHAELARTRRPRK